MTTEPISEPTPLASFQSPDGRSFTVRGPMKQAPRSGDYLRLDVSGTQDGGDRTWIGCVDSVRLDPGPESTYAADGVLLDVPASAGRDAATPPVPVSVSPASAESVAAVVAGSDPRLHLGRLAAVPEVNVGLLANKLNRHTFWCGQSGSGKTYALGVALERILTSTRLPIVVFDPNSDFVNLGRAEAGADPDEAAAVTDRDVVVLRPGDDDHPLRVRYLDLPVRGQAAVLRLDPVVDRAEYNTLLNLAPQFIDYGAAQIVPRLRELGTPDAILLAQRIENLGLLEWTTVWSDHTNSAVDVIEQRPAATVLDLGGYDSTEEQLAVSLGVLDHLWARRGDRRPALLVIDEAHNLCPPEPDTPLGVAVRDRLVQIAAEGRKYGLWLLVSTQRPSKVHQGVVSQCDNLTLMRMNSRADLAELGRTFGFVPEGLLERAAHFGLGEALVAGGFVPRPSIIKLRERVTMQGGSDVPVPMP